MDDKLIQLLIQIEQTKEGLIQVFEETTSLADSNVIHCSQDLDKLIVQYMKMKSELYNE